jgi:spore coat polysaccharide biosynthesis protein SpsF (cytidylyltransferase family)
MLVADKPEIVFAVEMIRKAPTRDENILITRDDQSSDRSIDVLTRSQSPRVSRQPE